MLPVVMERSRIGEDRIGTGTEPSMWSLDANKIFFKSLDSILQFHSFPVIHGVLNLADARLLLCFIYQQHFYITLSLGAFLSSVSRDKKHTTQIDI
jgi:hypothetical protein